MLTRTKRASRKVIELAAGEPAGTPITISGNGTRSLFGGPDIDREGPPTGDIETYRKQYRRHGFMAKSFSAYAGDTVEPGYRVECENDDLTEWLENWASSCADYAGETNHDLLPLIRQSIIYEERDGTATYEHVFDEDNEVFTGFKYVDPTTLDGIRYPDTQRLVLPEDEQAIRDGITEKTERGEAAAYVQNPNSDNPIYLSQNDITKFARDPDGIWGISRIEPISEELKTYRNLRDDYRQAIERMAYPWMFAEFEPYVSEDGQVIVDWDPVEEYDDDGNLIKRIDPIQEFMKKFKDENFEPGQRVGSPPGVNIEIIEGKVPDVQGAIDTSLENIIAGLTVPKYDIGWAESLNQFVTNQQENRFEKQVLELRTRRGRELTPAFKLKAREYYDDPESDTAQSEIGSIQFKIEAERAENPLEADEFDVEEFKQFLEALSTYSNSQASSDFPAEWIIEKILKVDPDSLAEYLERGLERDREFREQQQDIMGEFGPPTPGEDGENNTPPGAEEDEDEEDEEEPQTAEQ